MPIYGSSEMLTAIGYKPFKPRFPWYGADLQTIKSTLTTWGLPKVSGVFSRHSFPCEAGAISGAMNVPEATKPKALVLMLPGMGGVEDTLSMLDHANIFVEEGFAALRLNYRGSGVSVETSQAPFHAGLYEDIFAAISNMPASVKDLPVILYGYSLGGHKLLACLAEDHVPSEVIGGVSISAPLCLSSTMAMMESRRNIPYMQYLLWHLRRDLEPAFGPAARKIKSTRFIDETIVAPAFGFKDAEDYYKQVSVVNRTNKINTPVLVINAADDPWINPETYENAVWPEHPLSATILTKSGGHMGFHGVGDTRSWALDLTISYMNHLLSEF